MELTVQVGTGRVYHHTVSSFGEAVMAIDTFVYPDHGIRAYVWLAETWRIAEDSARDTSPFTFDNDDDGLRVTLAR